MLIRLHSWDEFLLTWKSYLNSLIARRFEGKTMYCTVRSKVTTRFIIVLPKGAVFVVCWLNLLIFMTVCLFIFVLVLNLLLLPSPTSQSDFDPMYLTQNRHAPLEVNERKIAGQLLIGVHSRSFLPRLLSFSFFFLTFDLSNVNLHALRISSQCPTHSTNSTSRHCFLHCGGTEGFICKSLRYYVP